MMTISVSTNGQRDAVAPVSTRRGPRIRVLSRAQMVQLLERNYIGRVAYALEHGVELHPVHYVYADGGICGRTSFGSKWLAWMHNPYVAFEVDECDGPFDWRSVVVKGSVYILTNQGSAAERAAYRKAVAVIRALLPHAFSARDPTPYRDVVFRIDVQELSGREATTG